jgi:accessory colonization factor AcfC
MPAVAVRTCTTNTAGIVVYTPGGTPPVNGTMKVATVYLKTTSVKGKTTVSFDRTRTFVVTSDTNTDILGTTNTSTITVT